MDNDDRAKIQAIINEFDENYKRQRKILVEQLNSIHYVRVDPSLCNTFDSGPANINEERMQVDEPDSLSSDDENNKENIGRIKETSSESDFEMSSSDDSTTEDSDIYLNNGKGPKRKKNFKHKVLKASLQAISSDDSDIDIAPTGKKQKRKERNISKLRRVRIKPNSSSSSSSYSSSSDSESESYDSDLSDVTDNSGTTVNIDSENKPSKISDSSSFSSTDECEIVNEVDSKQNGKDGRKNIRKIMNEKELREATKKANQEERARVLRIEEIEKRVKNLTDNSSNRLVLEFNADKSPLVEVDQRITAKFKKHQFEGVKFLWNCLVESVERLGTTEGGGCILAHSMGLGKSLQVVAFLHTLLTHAKTKDFVKRCIVVCPKNTARNWANEFYIWLPSKGSVRVFEICDTTNISERVKKLKRWYESGGVLIIGMEMFSRLVLGTKGINRASIVKCNRFLTDPGADIIIVDEGHLLKNEKTRLNEACNLVKTKRRVILTGTPLQNRLVEYHVMMDFVKPDLLGSIKEFTNRFVNPITNGEHSDSTVEDVKLMKKRVHVLHKMLDGCVQRFDYRVLTPYLQPKFEYILYISLTEVQQKIYQFYLDNLSRSSGRMTLFKDFCVFQCIWNHPSILYALKMHNKEKAKNDLGFPDDSESDCLEMNGELTEQSTEQWFKEFVSFEDRTKVEISGKMIVLLSIIKECEQSAEKLVIFSQSLALLTLIEEILKANQTSTKTWIKGNDFVRIDGSVNADLRKKWIDKFNDERQPNCRLFLVSTRAGSLGINLVGANRCVIFDACWNPTHDSQAVCRLYRFGQKKTVYVYRLIAQGTMEEKIYEKQIMKQSLSCRVVDSQQIQRHFSHRDLAELYRFFPDNNAERPTPVLPKDNLLADLLKQHRKEIVTYKQHDSLLENRPEEDLTEDERKAAWDEWEEEKDEEVQRQR
ncbi:Transcriptional regulator ATRX-like protein, partial [Leptotrombidium deliense]